MSQIGNTAHAQLWVAATRQLVRDAEGLDRAAAVLGVSVSQMARYQAAHEPDRLTAAQAMLLTEHTGSRAFGDLFAHLSGYRLEPIAEDPAPAALDRMDALSALVSEASEVIHNAGQSMRDGHVTDAELQTLRRVLHDFLDCADDVLAVSVSGTRA